MPEPYPVRQPAMNDATVLVTGGTGSFGGAMTRRLLEVGCPEIRIVSRDEAKQDSMRNHFHNRALKFYLGDVKDVASLRAPMAGVDFVFHAAALKQVPSCEFFPMQAVLTNVVGSANVIEAAADAGVQRVVCLSTDKAVQPINAMGMTKALMEKIAQAMARTMSHDRTIICTVRYGNVMYSRGSVLPLFVRQITTGQALTITEPSMTRFMLPLPVAVELAEFALAHGRQGDIFIRKAPAATVADTAAALLNLFGGDNKTEVIGMRHGEKIFETLATTEELRRAEEFEHYYQVGLDERDLNYETFFSEGDAEEVRYSDYTSHNTRRLDLGGVEELLLSLPEIQAELAASHERSGPARAAGAES